jgi:Leucine-rich repeat (LRR) protein
LIRSPLFGGRERYFIATGEGEVRELLTGDAEFTSNFGPGNLPDDPRAIKELITQGVKLLRRSPEEMIFAAEIPADAFQRRSLELLQRLPNLEQLQLRNCPLDENDLRNLLKLRTLRGLGLEGTPLDPNAIEQLERLPLLEVIER